LESRKSGDSISHQENSMNDIHYIGFDVHKKTIAICVKAADGRILEEETIEARRAAIQAWIGKRTIPWTGALEATLFTGWIYDELKPASADAQGD
jgi:hypothetical protein